MEQKGGGGTALQTIPIVVEMHSQELLTLQNCHLLCHQCICIL